MGVWGISVFESDLGQDVMITIRENLPQDRQLKLKDVLAMIKNSELGKAYEPSSGVSHTAQMTVAELTLQMMKKDYSKLDWEGKDFEEDNKFSDLISFKVDFESVQEIKKFVEETLYYARKTGQNGGWFRKSDWIKWQEYAETLIQGLEAIPLKPGEVIDIINDSRFVTERDNTQLNGMTL